MNSFGWFSSGSPSVQQNRRQLERLWQTPPAEHVTTEQFVAGSTADRKQDKWQQLGRRLYQTLTDTQQVRIWTKHTKAGMVWCAYDPVSDRRKTCHSESDLRAWLETRHRQ
ncbi:MAG: hypothetical protein AAFY72_15140 [Cyanobacteria bacterium J06649_4]